MAGLFFYDESYKNPENPYYCPRQNMENALRRRVFLDKTPKKYYSHRVYKKGQYWA